MLLSGVVLWLLPPMALVSGVVLRLVGSVGSVPAGAAPAGAVAAVAAVVAGPGWIVWASATVGVSTLFWAVVTRRFGAPWYVGAAYPVGAAVATWIVLKSWLRGGDVEWKGRSYGGVAGASDGDRAGG